MNGGERDPYDIAIVGAGPAGAACALALQESGLRAVLVDKAAFPRDKTCGDAIPARAEKVLRSIHPSYAERLQAFPKKVDTKGCRVVAPNQSHFDFYFQTPGYCSPRLDFDGLLWDMVREAGKVEMMENFDVREVEREDGNWRIREKGGREIQARALVACDGAQSRLARQLTGFEVDADHHCAAVRAYFDGVTGVDEQLMEIHFLNDHLPGYFWIFPVGNGRVNVGFGMLSAQVARKKVALRKALEEIVGTAPGIAERFKSARQEGETKGFGLPMGSRKVSLSGEAFLLCGDAAALVEPATGEGIGNAMLSGKMAAEQLVESFLAADLSAGRLEAYDRALYGKLWADLRKKYLAQRFLGERKGIMNWLVGRANRPGPVRWIMKKVF